MPIVYRTSAVSSGDGRNGHARTDDGSLDLDLATPKQQSGPGGATNPEQLLKATARDEGLTLTDSTVTVHVGLLKDTGFSLEIGITADLPGVDRIKGGELMALAHQRCPYSKATRGNIDVQLALA